MDEAFLFLRSLLELGQERVRLVSACDLATASSSVLASGSSNKGLFSRSEAASKDATLRMSLNVSSAICSSSCSSRSIKIPRFAIDELHRLGQILLFRSKRSWCPIIGSAATAGFGADAAALSALTSSTTDLRLEMSLSVSLTAFLIYSITLTPIPAMQTVFTRSV
jgi:hypothetical protein